MALPLIERIRVKVLIESKKRQAVKILKKAIDRGDAIAEAEVDRLIKQILNIR